MYRAPVAEIAFTLKHVAGLGPRSRPARFGDLGEDLVDAILEEAGRFATEEIAPLRKVGDEVGAVWKDAAVTTAARLERTLQTLDRGRLERAAGPEEFGGQGLPAMLGVAALEMWNPAPWRSASARR